MFLYQIMQGGATCFQKLGGLADIAAGKHESFSNAMLFSLVPGLLEGQKLIFCLVREGSRPNPDPRL